MAFPPNLRSAWPYFQGYRCQQCAALITMEECIRTGHLCERDSPECARLRLTLVKGGAVGRTICDHRTG